jgi:hypothetical protein
MASKQPDRYQAGGKLLQTLELPHDDFRRRMHDNDRDNGYDYSPAAVASAFGDKTAAGGKEDGNAGQKQDYFHI